MKICKIKAEANEGTLFFTNGDFKMIISGNDGDSVNVNINDSNGFLLGGRFDLRTDINEINEDLKDYGMELEVEIISDYYVSFGCDHQHVVNDRITGLNKIVKIKATSELKAREKAFEVFGRDWSSVYNELEYKEFLEKTHTVIGEVK